MNENTIISLKDNLISSESDNELFLMSLENNSYYSLNEIGKRIFEIIQKPITFNGIVKILISEYDVEEEVCKKDVREFLETLKKQNIINVD